MGGDGSGRRNIAAPVGEFPGLGNTEESLGEAMDAVFDGVLNGSIDPRTADTLQAVAKTKLSSIRQRKESARIEELQQMLADATAVLREVQEQENAMRTHRVNPPPAVTRAQKSDPDPD